MVDGVKGIIASCQDGGGLDVAALARVGNVVDDGHAPESLRKRPAPAGRGRGHGAACAGRRSSSGAPAALNGTVVDDGPLLFTAIQSVTFHRILPTLCGCVVHALRGIFLASLGHGSLVDDVERLAAGTQCSRGSCGVNDAAAPLDRLRFANRQGCSRGSHVGRDDGDGKLHDV